ncbi:MAG TPA: glycine cleavage system protein GcvH [Syntrophaceae bacterium]|nr:glycine cleavage system protein GcvH [Syntrophaceae bacterium]
MTVLEDLRYTKEHVWVRLEGGNIATIGITDYAEKVWGEVVHLELPEVGEEIVKDEAFSSIESTDEIVTDLYAPLSGVVIEVNEELIDTPELVNEDPYEDGWIIKLEISSKSELDELLLPDEYEEYVREEVIGTEEDQPL